MQELFVQQASGQEDSGRGIRPSSIYFAIKLAWAERLVALSAVILRKWSPSRSEGHPTKDLCIPDVSGVRNLPDRLMRSGAGILHLKVARNTEVLRLLSSGFAERKTALRMTNSGGLNPAL